MHCLEVANYSTKESLDLLVTSSKETEGEHFLFALVSFGCGYAQVVDDKSGISRAFTCLKVFIEFVV